VSGGIVVIGDSSVSRKGVVRDSASLSTSRPGEIVMGQAAQ
jgi:hypothetical protein